MEGVLWDASNVQLCNDRHTLSLFPLVQSMAMWVQVHESGSSIMDLLGENYLIILMVLGSAALKMLPQVMPCTHASMA